MNPTRKILRDLASGPATPSAVSERISMHPEAIVRILTDSEVSGLVTSRELPPIGRTPTGLIVYRLTAKGAQFAADPASPQP